jgi:hypothetical protein
MFAIAHPRLNPRPPRGQIPQQIRENFVPLAVSLAGDSVIPAEAGISLSLGRKKESEIPAAVYPEPVEGLE